MIVMGEGGDNDCDGGRRETTIVMGGGGDNHCDGGRGGQPL